MINGTRKLRTSPYYPQTNGQCKKFNSTLITMLGTLSPEGRSYWKSNIGVLVHGYNCTHNSAMGLSPYFLKYGRQPQHPINVALGMTLKSVSVVMSSKYIQNLRDHIKWDYKKANLFQQREAHTTHGIVNDIARQYP